MQQQRRQQVPAAPQVQAVAGGAQHQQRQEVGGAEVQCCKVEGAEPYAGRDGQDLGEGCQEEPPPKDLSWGSRQGVVQGATHLCWCMTANVHERYFRRIYCLVAPTPAGPLPTAMQPRPAAVDTAAAAPAEPCT